MTVLPRLTPADLEFQPMPDGLAGDAVAATWKKRIGDDLLTFRSLRTLGDLLPVEELQRVVFAGIADLDLVAAGMLIVVPDTGGAVLGAFRRGAEGEELVGFAIGWGGYIDRRPRILSDMLGVRPGLRGGGLGAELKKLQATLALAAGFVEMVWTVDPLRAANARLNFEKLGAYATRYEIDRYGVGFAPDLYGGMPTDRLHVTWPIAAAAVRDRLLRPDPARTMADVRGLPVFEPKREAPAPTVLVPIPSDIDALVRDEPDLAIDWRLRVRDGLVAAFEQGYAVTGSARADLPGGDSALVLTRGSEGTP